MINKYGDNMIKSKRVFLKKSVMGIFGLLIGSVSLKSALAKDKAMPAKKLIDESGLKVHSAVQLQDAADLVSEVLA